MTRSQGDTDGTPCHLRTLILPSIESAFGSVTSIALAGCDSFSEFLDLDHPGLSLCISTPSLDLNLSQAHPILARSSQLWLLLCILFTRSELRYPTRLCMS